MFKKIFNPVFYLIILAIAIIELLSFLGHFFLDIDHWVFAIVIILTLILSLKNIKYGVWIILTELFIGSQGYLLHLDIDSLKISLRIGLWLIVLAVWLKNFIFSIHKKNPEERSVFLQWKIFKTANFSYFIILFVFILFGAARGYFMGNDFQSVFFDFNGWLYFLLIFPFFEVFFAPAAAKDNRNLFQFWQIFAAAATWLCLKTFFLLFVFSHAFPELSIWHTLITAQTYQWVRDSLVGEITLVPSGFIRIFIQSQIFVVIAFVLGLFAASRFWMDVKNNKKAVAFLVIAGALILGTIIISFSRSFWVGAAAIIPVYVFWALKKYGWRNLLSISAILLASFILSLGIIAATVKFPIPRPSVSFDITQALTDRAGKITNEAAVSSRYALLPKLWEQIKTEPIWGRGFGAIVTYHTSDPRLLKQNPSGNYSTYAFEWGWLDIWLKLGFFGLAAYILLTGKIIKDGIKNNTWLSWGLSTGILAIAIVSVFSPYTNHPLGIGFLLLAAAIIAHEKRGSCACE